MNDHVKAKLSSLIQEWDTSPHSNYEINRHKLFQQCVYTGSYVRIPNNNIYIYTFTYICHRYNLSKINTLYSISVCMYIWIPTFIQVYITFICINDSSIHKHAHTYIWSYIHVCLYTLGKKSCYTPGWCVFFVVFFYFISPRGLRTGCLV